MFQLFLSLFSRRLVVEGLNSPFLVPREGQVFLFFLNVVLFLITWPPARLVHVPAIIPMSHDFR